MSDFGMLRCKLRRGCSVAGSTGAGDERVPRVEASMASSSRRAKKDRKQASRVASQRERFRQVMALVGINADFRLLPAHIRDFVRQRPYPKPSTVIHEDAEGYPESENIRTGIGEFMGEKKAKLDGGGEIALADFFVFFVPVLHRLGSIQTDPSCPALSAAVERAKATADTFYQRHMPEVLSSLLRGIDQILIEHTRIDHAIWWAKTTCEYLPDGRRQIQVALHLAKPQKIMIALDGGRPKPAFLSGSPHGVHGLRWTSWPSHLVGKNGDGLTLPVYVTEHALDQLRKRMTISGPGVEDFLWQSLLEPKLLPGDRTDEFLVEYRLYQYLLGYMPVRRLADKIIVKTFLFLTMTGTPQQRLLYKKLGLLRLDRVQQSLDQLNIFLTTDIQDDPVLRRVFAECGCGHLLDMAKPELRAKAEAGVAGNLRAFLGISNEADMRRLGFGLDSSAGVESAQITGPKPFPNGDSRKPTST